MAEDLFKGGSPDGEIALVEHGHLSQSPLLSGAPGAGLSHQGQKAGPGDGKHRSPRWL
jgi:hypothetical protein